MAFLDGCWTQSKGVRVVEILQSLVTIAKDVVAKNNIGLYNSEAGNAHNIAPLPTMYWQAENNSLDPQERGGPWPVSDGSYGHPLPMSTASYLGAPSHNTGAQFDPTPNSDPSLQGVANPWAGPMPMLFEWDLANLFWDGVGGDPSGQNGPGQSWDGMNDAVREHTGQWSGQ